MTQETHPALEKEREAFEAWVKAELGSPWPVALDRADAGNYMFLPALNAWKVWQARAAIAAQAPQLEIQRLQDELKLCCELKRQYQEQAAQAPTALDSIEQYRMQMAAISTAAIGYWKEGDGILPDYDTVPLRDVAKLYAKYDALYKAAAWVPLPVQAEPVADILLRAIQRLNQNPYSLTKGECITELEKLRELVKEQPAHAAQEPLTDEALDAMRQGNQGLNFVTLREFRLIARAVEARQGITGASE
jgi:hypothetical protein